jgi:cytochrome P460
VGMSRYLLLFVWMEAAVLGAQPVDEPVLYPNDYRGWVHVKSALITAAHPAYASEGGLHHVYANPKGAEGYKSGQFPDGSVIVYELLETHEKDGVVSEGARRRVDVMVKDSTRYGNTGGWGFERFLGADQTTGKVRDAGGTMCFECHAHAREHGFVFSQMR